MFSGLQGGRSVVLSTWARYGAFPWGLWRAEDGWHGAASMVSVPAPVWSKPLGRHAAVPEEARDMQTRNRAGAQGLVARLAGCMDDGRSAPGLIDSLLGS